MTKLGELPVSELQEPPGGLVPLSLVVEGVRGAVWRWRIRYIDTQNVSKGTTPLVLLVLERKVKINS